jgi:ABC-2 type transport system ATP-binding protein
MHPQETVAVSARNVRKSFGGRAVLQDLCFQVEHGSVVGLLGANGSGKTTLLKILLGLLPADSGATSILGADAGNLPPDVRARIGYVPQASQLFAWLTGKAMLRYVGSFYPNYDHEYAHSIAERLRVSLKTSIESLSPGQQQRLSIVRALATRPDFLILDEPMSALDPAARLYVIEELLNTRRTHELTVIVSSHIVHDLQRYCTHLAIVKGGGVAIHERMEFFAGFVRVRAHGEESLLASHTFAGASHVRSGEPGERFIVMAEESLAALTGSLPAGITVQAPEGDLETVLSEWMR